MNRLPFQQHSLGLNYGGCVRGGNITIFTNPIYRLSLSQLRVL